MDGTDVCAVYGVVCENDVAIVVLDTGPAGFHGKEIAQVVNRYAYYHKGMGYTNFLGRTAAQITQFGYPVAFDSGPWLMNSGRTPATSVSTPHFDVHNRVVATTSWGFVDDTLKLQGASRFDNNTAYPAPWPSNIQSLIGSACADYPSKCY